ncbi:hypothetical protein KQH54_03915 [bacterium]|nr:hypothetical protein [bacterium]
MQNGVWRLPKIAATSQFMERLLGYIRQNGTPCQIFVAYNLETEGHGEILSRFSEDRNQEYQEFLEQGSGYIAEIEKESAVDKFTFAELEESEQNLKRLKRMFQKIQSRDYFEASLRSEAQLSLHACVEKLHEYARRVYESKGVELTAKDGSLLDDGLLIDGHEAVDLQE